MTLQSKRLILGIDGGGSKTLASLAVFSSRNEFQVVGQGRAGASNLNAVGLKVATTELELAIERAFESAKVPPRCVSYLCMGMSGAGRIEEKEAWTSWNQENRIGDRIKIVTDAETVLAAGTPGGVGISLIAGTGSLAYGKSQTKDIARSGGWGYLLGDEGGGYRIAMTAINAILKAVDGRGSETALQGSFLQTLGLSNPQSLIGFVYRSENNRSEIAALSKLVFEASKAGDPVARAILDQAVDDLAQLVSAVVFRLNFSGGGYTLALTGGTLLHQESYRDSLLERLAQLNVEPMSVECVDDPSLGAIRIAAELLNGST
ncbi:N-acetylglucosamine kinase [Gimesia aquarii]|uniref:Glucosamine kinase GspK n=1 Tax=Gimesia aquarii TaxID=2527964 RepID=A0A517W3N6_9PLAN|nr:BadF/BadG/BcrA/BcrD ATPase family protein [Gimesia aquarii]QDT99858.1 Glucosamine kinase GspK [Gimesia aquarii]